MEEWRRDENVNEGMVSIPQTGSNCYSKSAKDTRDDFKEYFSSQQGAVKWQMQGRRDRGGVGGVTPPNNFELKKLVRIGTF